MRAAPTASSAGSIPDVAAAIVQAADEILAGRLRDQFVVDVYQAGAGTSHNMNTNEVLANRAGEILGEPRGTYKRVHPNDHVNMGQSTNDVFPTATRLSILLGAAGPAGRRPGLADALDAKAREFARVLKTGRTHLQDAVPITLGQEFGGYRGERPSCGRRAEARAVRLHELNLGATAVGTGLNAGDDFTQETRLEPASRATGLPLRPAPQPVPRHAEHGRRARVLRRAAAARRGSRQGGVRPAPPQQRPARGPRRNPAARRCSPDRRSCRARSTRRCPKWSTRSATRSGAATPTILAACDAGQLELNVMMPVIAWNALHASTILRNAMKVFADALRQRASSADEARCRELLDRSTAVATALSPYIGYAATADIAKTVGQDRPLRSRASSASAG